MSKMRRENSSPGYRRLFMRMKEREYDEMVEDTLRRQREALEHAHDRAVAEAKARLPGSTRRHLP